MPHALFLITLRRLLPILLLIGLIIACDEDESGMDEVISISIKTPPTKVDYLLGEKLDLSGLVIGLKRSNGRTDTVAFTDLAGNGITSSEENGISLTESKTIIFTHTASKKSASQVIMVSAVTELSIAKPPGKLKYFINDSLNLAGLVVTIKLDNKKTRDVKFEDFNNEGIVTTPLQHSKVTKETSEVVVKHLQSGKTVNQPIVVFDVSKDIDGNIYKVVKIGTQIWFGENLKTTRYQNGDEIGTTSPPDLNIKSEHSPKYQWAYNGNENDVATYGRLYTQFAAYDARNICPKGWRIPSQKDFEILTHYLINNGYNWDSSKDGNKLGKAIASKFYWDSYPYIDGVPGKNPEQNNSSGFSGLGSGVRTNIENNFFLGRNVFTYWWCTDSTSQGLGIGFRIQSFMIEADIPTMGDLNTGAPCRCIMNQ